MIYGIRVPSSSGKLSRHNFNIQILYKSDITINQSNNDRHNRPIQFANITGLQKRSDISDNLHLYKTKLKNILNNDTQLSSEEDEEHNEQVNEENREYHEQEDEKDNEQDNEEDGA